MANLTDTPNLTKTRRLTTAEGLVFTEIPAIGDGNCGWYAFALALMHLIKSDQLVLPDETYATLLAAIKDSFPLLKERVKLYRDDPAYPSRLEGNSYTDIAPHLEDVLRFFASEEAKTFAGFKRWIDSVNAQNSRFRFAAMHVALGPALRKIAIEQALPHAAPVRVRQLEELKQDGVDADQEALETLAHHVFHINLDTYDDERRRGQLVNTNLLDDIPRAPHVALVHVPGHWNFLLPPGEEGLACLPSLSNQASAALAVEERGLAEPMTQRKLTKVSQSLQAFSESLLTADIEDRQTVMNAAARSQRIVSKTLQELNITEAALKRSGLHGMALELVLKAGSEINPPASNDEAIARALQNAEIAAFLNNNYTVLTSRKLPKTKKEVSKNEHDEAEKGHSPRSGRS